MTFFDKKFSRITDHRNEKCKFDTKHNDKLHINNNQENNNEIRNLHAFARGSHKRIFE